ncbi:MAG: hypothetical protein AAF556_05490, partial [Pseudomonadota bacterium]
LQLTPKARSLGRNIQKLSIHAIDQKPIHTADAIWRQGRETIKGANGSIWASSTQNSRKTVSPVIELQGDTRANRRRKALTLLPQTSISRF